MEKKQFDNNNFVLYSPDSLNYITYKLDSILDSSLVFYKELFNIESFRKVQINLFDDQDKFINFLVQLRGDINLVPKYAKGTFDKGMINVVLPTNLEVNSPLFRRKQHTPSHELFHIMYKELILNKYNFPRITWFDEGMAQLFSNQYEEIINNNYDEFVYKVISKSKIIPKLNDLSHNGGFETEDYSGYNLSLIAVKYIYDDIGLKGFKKLLLDPDEIYAYGDTILDEIFKKYDKKTQIQI